MCAKQSWQKLAGESPAQGKTVESWYGVLRGGRRRPSRSVDTNCAGRNAKPEGSSVKGSSPVKHYVPEWPTNYGAGKATPKGCDSPRHSRGPRPQHVQIAFARNLGDLQGFREENHAARIHDQVAGCPEEKSDWIVVARKRSNARGAKGPADDGCVEERTSGVLVDVNNQPLTASATYKQATANHQSKSPLRKIRTAGSERGLLLSLTMKE